MRICVSPNKKSIQWKIIKEKSTLKEIKDNVSSFIYYNYFF